MSPSSYNQVPYESLPISYTYLPHLAGLARLLGLETAPPEACRVLDIGCAEGNNIIPMAWFWPKSQFVGVDLSEVQVNTGLEMVKSLSLENVQLQVKDLSELDAQHYEPFDYIILHGVFSWVEPETQHQILEVCQSLLAENGLIYISYNTYPGWHAQMVIRDAMKLYCDSPEQESSPEQVNSPELVNAPEQNMAKIPQALDYLKGFFTVADNEFSAFNIKRLTQLEQHSNQYLYHEFLETHNNPLYIKDFIRKARQHDLQYVSDALLAFDNTLILGQQRNQLLQAFDNRFEKLQYMDFMINQRFRRSLLCHSERSIRSGFAPEHMTSLAYRANLNSKKAAKLNNEKPCKFYQNDNKVFISIAHPVTKAALRVLADIYPSSISYMDLLQQASQKVADADGLAYIKKIEPFYQEFYLLLINDWLSTDIHPFTKMPIDWNKPLYISQLSWEYAQKTRFIPTFLLRAIDIDELALHALEFLKEGITKEKLLKNVIKKRQGGSGKKEKRLWGRNRGKQIEKQLDSFLSVLEKNSILYQLDY